MSYSVMDITTVTAISAEILPTLKYDLNQFVGLHDHLLRSRILVTISSNQGKLKSCGTIVGMLYKKTGKDKNKIERRME